MKSLLPASGLPLAVPVLLFLTGALISGLSPSFSPDRIPIAAAGILGLSMAVLLCLRFAPLSVTFRFVPSYLWLNLLFFITGLTLTSYDFRQFEKQSALLDQSSHTTGMIKQIDHYSKMDRLRIKIPAGSSASRPHFFNIQLLDKDHSYHPGQKIRIEKPLNKIAESRFPFDFDAYKYWKYQHTSHEVFLRDAGLITLLEDVPVPFFYRFRQNLKKRIEVRFEDPRKAGLLKALLLGIKTDVNPQDKNDFKRAGMLHILAVSGLHVGIISLIIYLFLYPVRMYFPGSPVHWLLTVIFIWIYAAVTGLNTPVVRASILATFFILARISGRKGRSGDALLWAVLIVMIIDPFSLFTISFQLSFGAVSSILLFYSPIRNRLNRLWPKHYLSDLIAVSAAAQIGIVPLLIYHFNEISTVGILSSLLAIPLLLPMLLAACLSLLFPAHFIFTKITGNITRIFLDLLQDISGTLGYWEGSSRIFVLSLPTLLWFSVALCALAISFRLSTPYLRRRAVFFFSACIFAALVSETYNVYQKRNLLTLQIFREGSEPVVDIYYKGYCYTNQPDASLEAVIKNRRKYYCQHIRADDKIHWNKILAACKDAGAGGTYRLVDKSFTEKRVPQGTSLTIPLAGFIMKMPNHE